MVMWSMLRREKNTEELWIISKVEILPLQHSQLGMGWLCTGREMPRFREKSRVGTFGEPSHSKMTTQILCCTGEVSGLDAHSSNTGGSWWYSCERWVMAALQCEWAFSELYLVQRVALVVVLVREAVGRISADERAAGVCVTYRVNVGSWGSVGRRCNDTRWWRLLEKQNLVG